MKVVGKQRIQDFCSRFPEAHGRLAAWLVEAERAQWSTPNDIKERYAGASFLAENRVVFNIGGNRFRLVAKIAYRVETLIVERVGTHAEYGTWEL